MSKRFCIGVSAILWGCLCGQFTVAGSIFIPGNGAYIFVPSTPVAGVVPNALPFTETFDRYPVPFWFEPPTNGWKQAASFGDASHTVPATELPVTPGEAYLFSGNCLNFETEGQTLYNVTTGRVQNVWVDMSVLMIPSEDLPREELNAGHQLGLCLDEFYRLNVFCGLTNVFLTSGVQFATWEQKVRLTLQIAYADNLAVPFFRVYIDQVAVNWSVGCRLPGVASVSGGEWLPCATTNRAFYGLGFMGCGYVDELKFSDTYVGPDAPTQAGISQAVAVSWMSDYGRRYQVETCADLASGMWLPFGAPILGSGTTNTVYDATGSVSRKFYRVTPLE